MLDALLRFSLRNRLATWLLAALLAVGGYLSFRDLTIEAFPDPTDTQVQLIALYEGQSAEEVERRVSLPLERALNGIPGMFRLRSISLFGLSYVTLSFEDEVDPWLARQQVMERLAGLDLPRGVQVELGPMATPIGEVYRYTLRSDSHDPMALRTLQDWVVRPQLRRVPGVADVMSYGGLQREIQVRPDPVRMADLGISIGTIVAAVEKASANATGGYVERGEELLVIRSLGTFGSIEELGSIRVGHLEGRPVHLREVASIGEGYAPRQGVVSRGADTDAVQGVVLMRRGENPSVVLDALRERVAALNGGLLPEGVEVSPFYDRTDLVDRTLRTVFLNLAEGALLVVVVLFLFLLSLKASLIVALVIPLSLAAAFLYLRLRGMSANLLSMGAIDFGIIVDGSVIMVEHLFHRLSGWTEGGRGEGSLADRVFAAAREVSRPTLYALLIIIAAYLPIFALERVEGRIFAPMAITVVSALVGAMLMTFTLVPVLCMEALRRPVLHRDPPILRWARRLYEPAVDWSLRNPLAVLVAAGGIFLSALLLVPRLGTEFLPELNEGSLYVTFTLPQNMSLTESRQLVPRLVEIFERTPEVEEVLTQLGRPEDGTDPKLSNDLAAFIKLAPMESWRPGFTTLGDLVEEMSRGLREIPGIEYNFSQPIRDNVNENISGQSGAVAVKFYGDDLDELRRIAEEAKAAIERVPGAADVALVRAARTPQIAIRLDRDALARHDLDLADVQAHLQTALAGHVANELWEGEWRFDVTVRLPPAFREDVDAIRNLLLPLPGGRLLPLAAVAEVAPALGQAAITRENGSRYVGVRMNVRDRDLGSFVREAQERVAAIRLPAGYQAEWGGEFENQERAMARLRLVLPVAILVTFLLLYSAFRSLWDAAMILLNIPLALVGGAFALAAAQLALSVSAAVGFIALLGQAVLNGVLVLSAIRARRQAGDDLFGAVANGARDRLRAVLMTALLASLGLVPAALSTAIGSETQRPIAVVIVGGTLSAALVTLVVLPVTYAWATRLVERLARKENEPLPVLPTA